MNTIFKYELISDNKYIIKTNNDHSGKIIGEFIKDVDGFFYFFLNEYNGGSLSSEVLGELSTKLIEINRDWNSQISDYFTTKN